MLHPMTTLFRSKNKGVKVDWRTDWWPENGFEWFLACAIIYMVLLLAITVFMLATHIHGYFKWNPVWDEQRESVLFEIREHIENEDYDGLMEVRDTWDKRHYYIDDPVYDRLVNSYQ